MKEYKKIKIRYVILSFFYLFFFKFVHVPLIRAFDSTILVGVVLALPIFCSRKMQCKLEQLLGQKSVLGILFACVGVIVFAVFNTIVHGAMEFSVCIPLFHQLIFLVVGLELYVYMWSKDIANEIIRYFIIAYCVQAVIQYLAFLSPAVHRFTNWFKTAETIDLQRYYDGFRMNAISGGLAFSLAAGYAVITAIVLLRWEEFYKQSLFIKVMILLILFAGGLNAGRTAIILDIFIIGCVLLRKMTKTQHTFSTKWIPILLFFIVSTIIVAIVFKSYLNTHADLARRMETVKYWLSKWTVYFSSSSSKEYGYNFWEDLQSKLPPLSELILGVGKYMEADGANYLHQDAGYIRALAFGGIPWLIVLFIYQKMFFVKSKVRIYESICIMALILIGTLKADMLGMLLQSQLILFPFFLVNLDEEKIKREKELGLA